MSATVTRRHRELAFAAMGAEPGPFEYVEIFIRTGLDAATPPVYPITARVAQALADIEAEALAEREHLEEGARLLTVNKRALYDDCLWDDEFDAFDRWLEAERARKAKP